MTKALIETKLLQQVARLLDQHLTGVMCDPPGWTQRDEDVCSIFLLRVREHLSEEERRKMPMPRKRMVRL